MLIVLRPGNDGNEWIQLLWTFSIYLEAVAIVPQLIVLQRYREVENLTGNYIFFLGAYRALYILNWVGLDDISPLADTTLEAHFPRSAIGTGRFQNTNVVHVLV